MEKLVYIFVVSAFLLFIRFCFERYKKQIRLSEELIGEYKKLIQKYEERIALSDEIMEQQDEKIKQLKDLLQQ